MFLIDLDTGIPKQNPQEQAIAKYLQEQKWTWDTSNLSWTSLDGDIQLEWEGSRGENDTQRGWPWDDSPSRWLMRLCGMVTIGWSLVGAMAGLHKMQATLNTNFSTSKEAEW